MLCKPPTPAPQHWTPGVLHGTLPDFLERAPWPPPQQFGGLEWNVGPSTTGCTLCRPQCHPPSTLSLTLWQTQDFGLSAQTGCGSTICVCALAPCPNRAAGQFWSMAPGGRLDLTIKCTRNAPNALRDRAYERLTESAGHATANKHWVSSPCLLGHDSQGPTRHRRNQKPRVTKQQHRNGPRTLPPM